jgi:hypothetical protein
MKPLNINKLLISTPLPLKKSISWKRGGDEKTFLF